MAGINTENLKDTWCFIEEFADDILLAEDALISISEHKQNLKKPQKLEYKTRAALYTSGGMSCLHRLMFGVFTHR